MNNIRVCAVSDLHGRLPSIPPCDVLLIVGDLCPDIHYRRMGHDPDMQRMGQQRWIHDVYTDWEQRQPARAIFMTPGNHDWITCLPTTCRTQFCIDELVEFEGKRFWFTPWVAPCGPWNYILGAPERAVRFADIPRGLDVLAAHSPVYGLGDSPYGVDGEYGHGGGGAGCIELRTAVDRAQPRFMVFGHIHEGQRYGVQWRLGPTTLFNVARWGTSWSPVTFSI